MTVRIKIDVSTGVFELEGEKEFVTEHLEKLMPIISTFQASTGDGDPGEKKQSRGDDEAEPEKKKRRTPKRTPGAQSCSDRIIVLRDKGFFKGKRSPKEIREGLEKEGWSHQGNQIAAALTTMFGGGKIKRTKEGNSFKYFWDHT